MTTRNDDDARGGSSAASGEVIRGEVVSGSRTGRDPTTGRSGEDPPVLDAQPMGGAPFGGSTAGGGAGRAFPGGYVYTVRPGAGYGQAGGGGVGAGGASVDLSSLKLKNPLVAGLLGLFLGPIGLLYASVPWALGTALIAVLLGVTYLWLLLPALWVLCGGVGFVKVIRDNAHKVLEAMTAGSARGRGSAAPPNPGGPGGPGGPRYPRA